MKREKIALQQGFLWQNIKRKEPSMFRRLLILFLIALPTLAALSIVAFAQDVLDSGGCVDISHSVCANVGNKCNGCLVDTGDSGTLYCFVTTCPQTTQLPQKACVASTQTGPCNSTSIVFQTCGTMQNPCTTWNCGNINPAGPGHPNPYCDIGSCNCTGDGGTSVNSWTNWRGCP
jgi:hypothetical protein